MRKIRIAIIGMGLMGVRHAQLLSTMDKFKLVGICDKNIKLKYNLNEFGVPFYNNVEKLISITKPDAVIIATPNETHLKVLQICTTYKVDILIEKPISDSIESSNKIIELSNSTDFNILIGHHRRYNNLIQKLRSIIISGEIGNLVAVSVIWGIMKPKDYFFHEWEPHWRRPGQKSASTRRPCPSRRPCTRSPARGPSTRFPRQPRHWSDRRAPCRPPATTNPFLERPASRQRCASPTTRSVDSSLLRVPGRWVRETQANRHPRGQQSLSPDRRQGTGLTGLTGFAPCDHSLLIDHFYFRSIVIMVKCRVSTVELQAALAPV